MRKFSNTWTKSTLTKKIITVKLVKQGEIKWLSFHDTRGTASNNFVSKSLGCDQLIIAFTDHKDSATGHASSHVIST